MSDDAWNALKALATWAATLWVGYRWGRAVPRCSVCGEELALSDWRRALSVMFELVHERCNEQEKRR